MTGEPCATGKPVYVFAPEGGSPKFTRFHEALRRHGATRPLPDPLRAARDLELRTAQLVGYDRGRDRPAMGEAAADAGRAARRRMSARPDGMKVPIVSLVVATAIFMENTDSTILATALPTIARDLAIDPISLKLAVTSYLVSLAVFIPISGWVADRVGSCTTFRLGARRVHDRLHRLRVLQLARPVRVLAGGAGPGRGHDGAGRAHGGDPHGAEGRAGAGAFLHRHARADRADAGAAAGRAHRHVCGLALDLLRQHPNRHPRHHRWRRCSSPRSRRRRRASMRRGSCCWRRASAA